jgi:hypothetical protein
MNPEQRRSDKVRDKAKNPSAVPTRLRRGRSGRALAGMVAVLLAFAAIAATVAAPAGAVSPAEFLTQFGDGEGPPSAGAGETYVPRGLATDPTNGHVYVADSGNNRISEFTAWGNFVKAWGWGVADGTSEELQTCTATCFRGLEGSGAGQLNRTQGVAVDSAGDVYVVDGNNRRVQKFDSDGNFLLAFGGDVVAKGPGDSANDEQQEILIASTGGSFKLSFEDPYGGGTTAQTATLPYNASAAEVQAALNGLATVGGLGGSVTVGGGPGDGSASTPYVVTFEGDLGGDEVPALEIDRSALNLPTGSGYSLECTSETKLGTISYSWLRNGVQIPGATSATYVTTAADEGAALQCQATSITASSGATQTANPVYVAQPAPAIAPPVAPSDIRVQLDPLAGENPRVGGPGQTLSCDANAASWQGASSFSYRWYRSGVEIAGATSSTYFLTAADLASPAVFQCAVIGTNAGGTATTRFSRILGGSDSVLTQPAPENPIVPIAKAEMEPPSRVITANEGGAAEVCSAANGDVCKEGNEGAANGQFGVWSFGSFIAVDRDGGGDTVYVGDQERIQAFGVDGAYKSEIALPAEASVWALTVDPAGKLYVSLDREGTEFSEGLLFLEPSPNVMVLSPGGAQLETLEAEEPNALATGPAGEVFVLDGYTGTKATGGISNPVVVKIHEFDSDGEEIASFEYPEIIRSVGIAANAVGDIYVSNIDGPGGVGSYIRAYGPGPVALEPPPAVAPEIASQYAASVDTTGATLQARIDPNFWPDATFYVQYGTADCEAGGCAEQPVAPGSLLTKKSLNSPLTTPKVFLAGLKPATTYHYRFVAVSGGGGPVFGADRTFTTFAPPNVKTDCPNQTYRTGAAARLADCRAYEMVSPVEKNGGDTIALLNGISRRAGLDQSSTSGQRLSYSTYRSFGDAKSAPYTSQYIASRDESGWSSRGISPPRDLSVIAGDVPTYTDSQFQLLSPDLSEGWLLHDSAPLLAPGAVSGFINLYRRFDASDSYEALTTAAPPHGTPVAYVPEMQGVSADGTHAIFLARDNLTPDAPILTSVPQLYESVGGALRLVSVLPNGTASKQQSWAGTHNNLSSLNRLDSVQHAISDDGSRIFWSSAGFDSGPGKIYVRIGGEETRPVSESVSTAKAQFWTAAADGSKAIFSFAEGARAGQLYEFDVDSEEAHQIAEGVTGVVGASEDASHVYFVSKEALAGGATEGEPNLYLYEAGEDGGTYAFVATLSDNEELSIVNPVPIDHYARVTPDGRHLAFVSNAALTDYDNLDVASGKADAEVYRYDADSKGLECVSCNPSGARPAGRDVGTEGSPRWAAAQVPAWTSQFYQPRYLSDDGSRLFFESFDALVPEDTNGKGDVYQWEAEGVGDCADEGGCVSLISSGESPQDTKLLDASPSGSDVFIATHAGLLPQDAGLVDIYDAREGGGLPPPAEPPGPCEGDACQNAASPPNDQTPASASFHGPGSAVVRKPSARRCAAGKRQVRRKGKARCVPKKNKRRHKREQRHNEGTGR